MNRPEPQHTFGQLPPFYQEFIKALWRAGVLFEVYGKSTRKWQPVNQRNMAWTGSNYYRVVGDVHWAHQKQGRTSLEAGHAVFIRDPEALPEHSLCYMVDGQALSATVTPYPVEK